MKITGTHIAYKLICDRELWFFINNIQCEQESDIVLEGKLLHENSYSQKNKEIAIGPIKLDWVDLQNKVIHEVKKSNKMEESHIWQLKYYIYYLRVNHIGDFTGELNYPKLKKVTKVTLSEQDIPSIQELIKEIENIKTLAIAPKIEKPIKFCKTCSYFDLCWI